MGLLPALDVSVGLCCTGGCIGGVLGTGWVQGGLTLPFPSIPMQDAGRNGPHVSRDHQPVHSSHRYGGLL